MRKSIKHLLGLAGLALVGAMTVVACAIPAPEASASKVSVPVRVQVESSGETPVVYIKSLYDGDVVINRRFKVTIEYAKANELHVFIGRNETRSRAGETEINAADYCEIVYSESTQECEVPYNLSDYDLSDPDGVSFTTRAVAINSTAGNSTSEDSLQFMYRAAYLLEFDGEYESKNGDPIVEAILGEDVKSAYITILDKDGKRITTPYDTEYGYKLGLSQKDGDSLKVVLPLWEAGAPAGEYTVVLTAFDTDAPSDDGMVAVATIHNVEYKVTNATKPGENEPDPNLPSNPDNPNHPGHPGHPGGPSDPSDPNNPGKPGDGSDTPDVPGTGLNIFSDLNISQADYIITGLVAFGMVTIFAVFLMIRRSRR